MKLNSRLDDRARRLLFAVSAGVLGRAVTLLAPLLATPAMLGHLGDADFGIWVTCVSITSMAVVADFGIGNGLLTKIADAYGREDYNAVRGYLSSAYATLAAIAAVLSALTLLISLALPQSEIALGVLLVFFLGLPGTVFHQFLFGIQRIPLSYAILALGSFLSVTTCLIAIRANAPHWLAVVAYSLPSALISYCGAFFFSRSHTKFRPSVRVIDPAYVRDLFKLGSQFFLLSILTAVGLNIDALAISFVVGAEAVTPYAVPMRLGSLLGLGIMAIYMPLWSANGEALARGDYRWVQLGALRMSIAGVLAILVVGIFLVLLSDHVMALWVGRSFADQDKVLAAVVITSAIIAATSPYNMILNAMGMASSQVQPWMIFVSLSIAIKLAVLASGVIWPVAAVTGLCYLVVISPAIIVTAKRELKTHRESRLSP